LNDFVLPVFSNSRMQNIVYFLNEKDKYFHLKWCPKVLETAYRYEGSYE
jgi:hypothetical protein